MNSKGETFIDTLARYGSKYQMDKNTAQNSLFGGLDVVEVATPEIPQAEPWSALERLNRERELVGIYLSAHPLDDYSVIMTDVCNVHAADLQQMERFANSDLKLGGMVTGVRKGVTKTGKPYGIVQFEDYSGSMELPLFGQDWAEWASYMEVGNTLMIYARCQPRQWNPNQLELKVGKIDFLADIRDSVIEKITIAMNVDALDDDTLLSLQCIIRECPGNSDLYFLIADSDGQTHLNMHSRSTKVSVKKNLISFIESKPALSYKIN